MKAPAFQFYADDFIGGTCHFSAAEVGAYIRLLCHQWGNGEIPIDHDRLERIAGGPVTAEVLAKFPNRKNEKMEKVRAASEKFRAACADAGRRGGGNPNFEKGKPNPYKGQDKGQDKGSINDSDKGRINSPISDLRSPSPVSDLQTPTPSNPKNIPAASAALFLIEGFADAWEAFVKHRKKLRKPLTDRAAEIIQRKLMQKPHLALDAVDRCIEKGWQSFEWDWLTPQPSNGGPYENGERPQLTEEQRDANRAKAAEERRQISKRADAEAAELRKQLGFKQ